MIRLKVILPKSTSVQITTIFSLFATSLSHTAPQTGGKCAWLTKGNRFEPRPFTNF